LEEQADTYAKQIRSDHKKRLKELRVTSKQTYERLHSLFGISFARQHLARRQQDLENLLKWSEKRSYELKRSARSRAKNIEGTARAIEKAAMTQISNLERRLTLELKRELLVRLRSQHVKLLRDATHHMLLAERKSMSRISKVMRTSSETTLRHKEQVMENLTRMVQASVLEETKAKDRADLELIRKRRLGAIESALSMIDLEIDSKREGIYQSVSAHANSISNETELRIKKLRLETSRDIEKLRMLYGDDTALEYETNSQLREDFELRERFEGEREVLNLLRTFLDTKTTTKKMDI
jgi:hypothetical protein